MNGERPSADLFDVIGHQRACREFSDAPVPDEMIAELLRAATHAPSAENRQPWEFVVVRDATTRAALCDLARRAWESGARDWERDRLEPSLFADVDRGMTSGFASAPVWVVVCADNHRGLEVAAAESTYPAVQNLLLAASAMGLGSALTTIAHTFADDVRELLGLPHHVAPMASIPLGHPARDLGPPRRDPFESHAHRERFGVLW